MRSLWLEKVFSISLQLIRHNDNTETERIRTRRIKNMEWTQQELEELYQATVKKATVDADFREKLKQNAKTAMEELSISAADQIRYLAML